MKQLFKNLWDDLPIYINGFAVGLLVFTKKIGVFEIILYCVSAASFFWYGYNQRRKNG